MAHAEVNVKMRQLLLARLISALLSGFLTVEACTSWHLGQKPSLLCQILW